MWTWESIRPGRRVQPVPSISGMSDLDPPACPTPVMVPSVTVTDRSLEKLEPSNRSTWLTVNETKPSGKKTLSVIGIGLRGSVNSPSGVVIKSKP